MSRYDDLLICLLKDLSSKFDRLIDLFGISQNAEHCGSDSTEANNKGGYPMKLTSNDLDLIERTADKKKNPQVLLIVQVLREIREIRLLLTDQDKYTCHSSND